ncbi:MAG: hypothetical protein ACO1O4_14445 [Devosia sp.]
MTKSRKPMENRAPFTREEISMEVRRAALGMASMIAAFGQMQGQLEVAAQYLGVELNDYDYHGDDTDKLMGIPIEKHFLHRVVMDAYDHAYQVGPAVTEGVDWDERAHEVAGILSGFPQTDYNGEPSPLDRLNPQKLRQVLDTFNARYMLDIGLDLTIAELALLANMGESAVRTSLSNEGIKTIVGTMKGEKNQVRNEEAMTWLLGRRNFVPTKRFGEQADNVSDVIRSLFNSDSLPFEVALTKALKTTTSGGDEPLQQAGIDPRFVEELLSPNGSVDVDVAKLERLAVALQAPVPIFVGKAVTAILTRREADT